MDSMINRYRNMTVLLLVLFAQLVLVAVQVKSDQDVPLVRVWAVTAFMPLARAIEGIRSGIAGVLNGYFFLYNADKENRQLKDELGRLKIENVFLRNELAAADRAKALAAFQARTPSRMLPARVIGRGAGAGSSSKSVFVDRGSRDGVERGMGVLTPDGIVGKIVAVYPTASLVTLVTDPDFAAGAITQKHHVSGTLKGQGYAYCKFDYVANEAKVEVGEWLYTSGDDRIFPKGFPVGIVRSAQPGAEFQQIMVEPKGLEHGVEELLILVAGTEQDIPEITQAQSGSIYLAPPPEDKTAAGSADQTRPLGTQESKPLTDADRLRQRYKAMGEAQGHVFGTGAPGSKPPDFNLKLPQPGVKPNADGHTAAPPPAAKPDASKTVPSAAPPVPREP